MHVWMERGYYTIIDRGYYTIIHRKPSCFAYNKNSDNYLLLRGSNREVHVSQHISATLNGCKLSKLVKLGLLA